eukprot:3613982-Karenia_brevis.AAC.1
MATQAQVEANETKVALTKLEEKLEAMHLSGQGTGKGHSAYSTGDRHLQIIVGGFDEELDEEKVVDKIEQFLKVGTRRSKVTKVMTFTDPSKIGVIEFESEKAKIGFYKKIRDSEKKPWK